MKRTIKILGICLIFISFFNTGCKKYEDGPLISFLSRENRISNTWKVSKLFADGEAVELDEDDKKMTFEYNPDGKYIETNGSGVKHNGYWSLADKDENIYVTMDNVTSIYKILRLKKDEMWLEINFVGLAVMEVHYVPK